MNDKPDLYFNGGVHWYLHPRFASVQRPAAYGLYWAMTAWARDNLSDGFVPDAVVTSVLAGPVKADPVKDRAELIRVGLLREGKDGVELHRFLGWNDSADKVKRRQDAARTAAQERWHSVPDANGTAFRKPLASPAHSAPHTTLNVERRTSTSQDEDNGVSRSSSKNSKRARRAS